MTNTITALSIPTNLVHVYEGEVSCWYNAQAKCYGLFSSEELAIEWATKAFVDMLAYVNKQQPEAYTKNCYAVVRKQYINSCIHCEPVWEMHNWDSPDKGKEYYLREKVGEKH